MRGLEPVSLCRVVRVVIGGFLRAYRYILILGGIPLIALWIISAMYGEAVFVELASLFFRNFYLGLVGGFLVHEFAHALAIPSTMRVLKTVSACSTAFRFSVQVEGASKGWGDLHIGCDRAPVRGAHRHRPRILPSHCGSAYVVSAPSCFSLAVLRRRQGAAARSAHRGLDCRGRFC